MSRNMMPIAQGRLAFELVFIGVDASFEVFTAVKIQVQFFWVVTPSSVSVGYWRFGGLCNLHFQGEVTDDGKKKSMATINAPSSCW